MSYDTYPKDDCLYGFTLYYPPHRHCSLHLLLSLPPTMTALNTAMPEPHTLNGLHMQAGPSSRLSQFPLTSRMPWRMLSALGAAWTEAGRCSSFSCWFDPCCLGRLCCEGLLVGSVPMLPPRLTVKGCRMVPHATAAKERQAWSAHAVLANMHGFPCLMTQTVPGPRPTTSSPNPLAMFNTPSFHDRNSPPPSCQPPSRFTPPPPPPVFNPPSSPTEPQT